MNARRPDTTANVAPTFGRAVAPITVLLLGVCAVEMVLGGPGVWKIAGLSIRRAIFVVVAGWLVFMCLLGQIRVRRGHAFVLLGLGIFWVVWGLLIPVLYQPSQLGLAFQEGLPLGFLILSTLAHAFFSEHPEYWPAIRKTAGYSGAFVAGASIALWAIGTALGPEWPLVSGAVKAFFTLGQLEDEAALYIMEMPDGFFRVMWITSVLFVPGFLLCWADRNRAGVVLFAAALFTSYTRALWAVALLGVAIAFVLSSRERARPVLQRRWGPWILAGVLLVGLVGLAGVADDGDSHLAVIVERVQATFTDDSAGDRIEQFGPLMSAWESAPVFGHGFGSVASIQRSEQAPYLYELTYPALLMKVGVLGLLALLAFLARLMSTPFQRGVTLTRRGAAVWSSVLAVLGASATNPYLLNLVGMSALSFLFIELDITGGGEPQSAPIGRQDGP